MVGLLKIRRALMGTGDPHLKFKIANRQVSAGDSVSTGFAAFASGVSTTILLDFTLSSRPSSGNGSNFKLIYSGTPFQYGTRNTSSSTTNLYYYWLSTSSYTDTGTTVAANSRYLICITHEAGSGTVYVKTKKDTGSVLEKSKSGTFAAASTVLSFGNPNTANGLPNGTINSAKVYDRVLSASEIDAFFA